MLTVTFTSHTWLASYTTTPQEPSVVTFCSRTSLLPPPIPMLEKIVGSEWTASPETVTLREARMDKTYELDCGLVAGCCKFAPCTPISVKPLNPSIRTYSVQVPFTVSVAGVNLSILAKVRLSDCPASQSTVGLGLADAKIEERKRVPKASAADRNIAIPPDEI